MTQTGTETAHEPKAKQATLREVWQSPSLRLFTIIVGAATIALYTPAFHWLYTIWRDDKEYSHGFLVPLIALYLCWIKRDQLRSMPIKPSVGLGVFGLICAAAMLAFGRAGGYPLFGAISFLLFLPACIALFYGANHVWKLALPLAYLQFAVPWMDTFMEKVYPAFQVYSAKLAVNILHGLGYPVLQSGKYIYMPNIAMEVAKECSGIRFLTSVIALGIPLVYLSQRNWKRALSVLSIGAALAILTNGVRVAIAGILGTKYGAGMLHGPFHIFQGWFVAQVGLILLFILNAIFERLPNPDKTTLATRGAQPVREEALSGPTLSKKTMIAFGTASAALAGYLFLFAVPRPQALAKNLEQVPTYIGEWRGRQEQWTDAAELFPKADQQLLRTYLDTNGRVVHLLMVHYDVQTSDKAAITFHERDLHRHAAATNIASSRVSQSLSTISNSEYRSVSWFYVAGSGPIPNRLHAKLGGLTSALFQRRNDATVVVIAAPLDAPGGAAQAAADALRFATVAFPEVDKVIH